MGEITLKRANVLKRVDSEDKARVLEAQGFVRTSGGAKAQAAKAGDGGLQKELADARERLREAQKRIQNLELELEGAKEQLEAALKQNKATGKK